MIFDKTGTLTQGEPALAGVVAATGVEERSSMALTAAVEADSEHPLAAAVVRAVRSEDRDPTATDFEAMPGRGARARVGTSQVEVGGPRLLTDLGLAVPPDLAMTTDAWARDGQDGPVRDPRWHRHRRPGDRG